MSELQCLAELAEGPTKCMSVAYKHHTNSGEGVITSGTHLNLKLNVRTIK